MNIGIHYTKGSFSDHWVVYCKANGIPFKLVNCYRSDIIDQLSDCDVLMWHHSQTNPKDILFAKQLLFSLMHAGKKVFPDFLTNWHFDDKVGQKYLLEALGAPLVPTWVFYEKDTAIKWIEKIEFPLVFKLRSGAGSSNVRLVQSKSQAIHLINKAFKSGFSQYNSFGEFKDKVVKFRHGKLPLKDVVIRFVLQFITPKYSLVAGNEKGYIYFQKFIPFNDHDIRVIVIGDKAFAIKRLVRRNDFRASGSGDILYAKEHFNEEVIILSFELAEKLKMQCVAFDYVFQNEKPLLLEISYGFVPEGYKDCIGYWDKSMTWNNGIFNPYGWMIENLVDTIK
jgi:glutathione synthase/RimK-type ligase-like ATP-grasp enzyme